MFAMERTCFFGSQQGLGRLCASSSYLSLSITGVVSVIAPVQQYKTGVIRKRKPNTFSGHHQHYYFTEILRNTPSMREQIIPSTVKHRDSTTFDPLWRNAFATSARDSMTFDLVLNHKTSKVIEGLTESVTNYTTVFCPTAVLFTHMHVYTCTYCQQGKCSCYYRRQQQLLGNLCSVINPRRACAARVTVVVPCVCLSVCLSVCYSYSGSACTLASH